MSIEKLLLRKEVFDSISVFIIMTFPYNDRILGESLFICFSILSILTSQFSLFAYCKSSLKYIPNILIVSFCSIVISFSRFASISVFISITVVFSRLVVAPVASFNFWKYFKTFFTDFWSYRKKFEPSAIVIFLVFFSNLVLLILWLCCHCLYFQLLFFLESHIVGGRVDILVWVLLIS